MSLRIARARAFTMVELLVVVGIALILFALVVPAMNHRMWLHPATQAGAATLRGWGVRFIEPAEGMHACGEGGPGRLPDPESIAADVLKALGQTPSVS